MEKMRMTNLLAEQLMDSFFAVAISATGGIQVNEYGEPIIIEEQVEMAQEYARETFKILLEDWEILLGKEWEIEMGEEKCLGFMM